MRNDPRLPDETLSLLAFLMFPLRQLLPPAFDFPNVLLPSPFHDVVLLFDGGHCAAGTPRWGVGPRPGRGRRVTSPPGLALWFWSLPPELLRYVDEVGSGPVSFPDCCDLLFGKYRSPHLWPLAPPHLWPLVRVRHTTTFCAGWFRYTSSFRLSVGSFRLSVRAVNLEGFEWNVSSC